MADEHVITLVANPAAPLSAHHHLPDCTSHISLAVHGSYYEAARTALGVQPLITLLPAALELDEVTTTFTPYLPSAALAPATSLPQITAPFHHCFLSSYS